MFAEIDTMQTILLERFKRLLMRKILSCGETKTFLRNCPILVKSLNKWFQGLKAKKRTNLDLIRLVLQFISAKSVIYKTDFKSNYVYRNYGKHQ